MWQGRSLRSVLFFPSDESVDHGSQCCDVIVQDSVTCHSWTDRWNTREQPVGRLEATGGTIGRQIQVTGGQIGRDWWSNRK